MSDRRKRRKRDPLEVFGIGLLILAFIVIPCGLIFGILYLVAL